MELNKRRAVLILSTLLLTFISLRIYLHLFPGTNFDVGAYNIHHLFTGLVLITLGGLPLIIFSGNNRLMDISAVTFGVGLIMALDEWVYLIATDGSDASYLLPVSLWGAVIVIAMAASYMLVMLAAARRCNCGRNG